MPTRAIKVAKLRWRNEAAIGIGAALVPTLWFKYAENMEKQNGFLQMRRRHRKNCE
jgi:hypothetical protein